MKQIKKYLKLFSFLILITVSACQLNDEKNNSKNQDKTAKVKHIELNELFKSKKFAESYSKVSAEIKSLHSKNSKTVMEEQYGFIILDQPASVIANDSITSYTLLVDKQNKETPETLCNLVIENNTRTGIINAYILKYISNTIITDIKKFNGQIKVEPILYNPQISTTGRLIDVCLTIMYFHCENHDPAGGIGCQAVPQYQIVCYSYDDGSSNTGGGSGGGGGGGNNTVVTAPVTNNYTYSPNRANGGNYLDLSTSQITFLNSVAISPQVRQLIQSTYNPDINQTDIIASQVVDFLQSNQHILVDINNFLIQDNSTSNREYVNQFLNNAIQNPSLHLDFNLSSKSPAFIDFSSIDKNTPEGAKFNDIYNSVIKSPTFKNLFLNLFNETPLFNLKFKIVDIPQTNPNGHIDGSCTYVNDGTLNPLITILIDKSSLLARSKVDVAENIIHECIHAFLDIKFRNPTIGMSISTINNMDLQQCINTYYNGFSGNQTQHNFFVNNMIPTLVQILTEIKDFIITPIQANEMENPTNGAAFVYAPLNNPPTLNISPNQVQWNWTTFFNYFSYNGLQNCTAYPFTSPMNNSHVFNNNDDYYHYKYISAFNAIFNP